MNIFTLAFQEILLKPILNLFVYIEGLPYIDFGMAVLILTILIKVITWPLNTKAIVSQREIQGKTQELQDKIKEIKEEHKNDTQKQNEEIMKIWREKKINPFASFAPLIIQIIILIAFYQVLRVSLQPEGLNLLYSFISRPEGISPMFLGFLDLSKSNAFLAVITGFSQYFYSKISLEAQPKKNKTKNSLKKTQKIGSEEKIQKMLKNQMLYFMPVFTVFICLTLPASLALYWLSSTAIGILQYKIIYKKPGKGNKEMVFKKEKF